MSASKRVALALGALFIGFLPFATPFIVAAAIRQGPKAAMEALPVMLAYLLFTLAGFVLAVPFVNFIKHADGARAWLILIVGISIGPCFFLVWTLIATHGHFSWTLDGIEIIWSLEIGVPTTIVYLLLLRRFGSHRLLQKPARTS